MPYRDYLRWEGTCSILLGAALAALAWPGWLAHYDGAWLALLAVPATLAVMALLGSRAGGAARRPGTWRTTRPLADADARRPAVAPGVLRRRLALETAVWIVAVGAWVAATGDSGWLVLATGLASVAFGAVSAGPSARHVQEAERRAGGRYRVSRRPALGTPELAGPG